MVGARDPSSAGGPIPTAALPAVRVLVLAARSFVELAAACASVTLSKSGSGAGPAAAVGLTGPTLRPRTCPWTLSSLSPGSTRAP